LCMTPRYSAGFVAETSLTRVSSGGKSRVQNLQIRASRDYRLYAKRARMRRRADAKASVSAFRGRQVSYFHSLYVLGEELSLQIVGTNDSRDNDVIGSQVAAGRRIASHPARFQKNDFVGVKEPRDLRCGLLDAK
jgi:hypothetical protein